MTRRDAVPWALALCLCVAALLPSIAFAQDGGDPYFSLSSQKTYMPGEKPEVAVYSHNVRQLEFRVYRVNDPVKFFSQLQELHNFGGRGPRLPKQPRTWLEKFHAWKHSVWAWVRDFVRTQFSEDNRHEIRLWRLGETEQPKKQGPQVENYAQVPVLNQQQVVSVWKWTPGSHEAWESEIVKVPVSDKGVYLVEATNGSLRAYTVIVVTDIAIITKAAPGRLVSYVVERKSGDPISGAPVKVWIDQQEVASGHSDGQGILDTKITDEKPEDVAVLVTHGDEFAINTPGAWNLGGGPDRNLRGYTYTDRPVYRPGDTVHFKTIIRAENPNGYTLPQDRHVSLELRDPQTYQPIWNDTAKLNDYGSAHWEYQIPADAHLGSYYLSIKMGERYVEGSSFSVQDYKKPEYAVKVTAQTPRVLQGQPIKATIDARYYFGEPVANAKVTWVVHTSVYYPPGRWASDDEDVGEDEGQPEAGEYDRYGAGEQEQENSGTLDPDGKLQITVLTTVSKNHQDLTYRIEARVTDAGNREISGHGYAVATYGSFYVTAQPDAYVYTKGSTAKINVTVQDYDRKPIATAFKAEISRWNWQKRSGETITTAQGQTDASGKGQVDFVVPDAGEFRVRVSAMTPEHREVEDSVYLWAPGESPWWMGPAQENVKIVPDKKSYVPGDTAHVLIVTGKAPASVLVTAEGNGLYSAQVIKSNGGSITVDVPIKPEYAPNFYVAATFIRDNKLYQGNKSLSVPPSQHELKVDLTPSKPQYQPGEGASYTIKATDASGKPVSAEFSLGVVDEAIYAIQPETVLPILKAFYGTIYSQVSTDTSLTYYFSGQAGKRAMQLASVRPHRSLAQLKPEKLVQPKVRKAFPDTAYWIADVDTDSGGKATVKFDYPDAITSWRATTRGVTQDTKVGSAVENTIVRKNLMVRLVVPRFFRRGDEIVLSTIVQNYLPTQKTARVSMEFTGLQVIDGGTKDVPVPSRGLVKVDYRVRVLDVDSAKVLGKALTDVESDAMELTLPVEPFGVKLATAVSGSFTGSNTVSQTVTFPAGIEANTRKLSITLTPTIAGTVFGALDYLTSYPYGCTEQTMSSFLPDVLVSEALKKLGVKSNVDPAVLNKQVQAGLERLYNYHHPDGGWGWWQTDDSHPFMTAYVLAGLVQAKAAGYEVRQDMINSGRKWLLKEFANTQNVRSDLRAYMAYALVLSGTESNATVLDSVWTQRSTLTPYGQALLGLAMQHAGDARAGDLVKQLESSAKQTESQAWWPTDVNYLMDYYGDTTPQATAYAMKLLVAADPQSPLLPKAAQYLVDHRSQGYYWESTQQTAAALYGLTDYLEHTQELKPDFTVDVKVNGKEAGSKKFTSENALAPATAMTLNDAQLEPESNQVQFAKSGNGRLYWSTRGEYYSSQSKVVNTGTFQLSVVRQYYKLTSVQRGDHIVYHMDPLNGPVQVGDTLAVRITVGGNEWRYLMIEDPIPSGTESLARDDLYELDNKPDWWTRGWGYRELYDDRTTFFSMYFRGGLKEYTYLLKVVNPGEFRVSPTRVEPMYQPEYLATSNATKVSVK